MCIIAIKPKKVKISNINLKNCWDNNPDGAGFMYSENNELIIEKGLMTFEDFSESYNKINPENKDVVIHFRYGTHGKVCKELTHPFSINSNLALVHNGIFDIDSIFPKRIGKDIDKYIKDNEKEEKDFFIHGGLEQFNEFTENLSPQVNRVGEINTSNTSDTSDTLEFCKILKRFPKDFLSRKEIYFLLNSYVEGESSVVVFMDNLGIIDIIGINDNYIDNGVWYSNLDYSFSPKDKKTIKLEDVSVEEIRAMNFYDCDK